MTDHAQTITLIRSLTEAPYLQGAFGPHEGREERILAALAIGGFVLPNDPQEAFSLAVAINAELVTDRSWCHHPGLTAALFSLPNVIEQTKDRKLLRVYLKAITSQPGKVGRLDWLATDLASCRDLVARLAA